MVTHRRSVQVKHPPPPPATTIMAGLAVRGLPLCCNFHSSLWTDSPCLRPLTSPYRNRSHRQPRLSSTTKSKTGFCGPGTVLDTLYQIQSTCYRPHAYQRRHISRLYAHTRVTKRPRATPMPHHTHGVPDTRAHEPYDSGLAVKSKT